MSSIANLSSIWGISESTYSGVIAQTLAFSSTFRSFFLQQLARYLQNDVSSILLDKLHSIRIDDSVPINVNTEQGFDTYGRTDVCVTFVDEMVLVIENKVKADLQPRQLIRYDEYLGGQTLPFLLLLVAPSQYVLPVQERPPANTNFSQVSYRLIARWIDTFLVQNTDLSEFERNYLRAVYDFFSEVEMSTVITSGEINALEVFGLAYNAHKKLSNVIRNFGVDVESNIGNYLLGHRMIQLYPVYFGFRYGTKWYYSAPLLDNKCEAIVYVKDTESNVEKAATVNERLKGIKDQLAVFARETASQVDYYERRGSNECRLAIRKRLDGFMDGDLDRIRDWLKLTLETLEKRLVAGSNSDAI